MTKDQIRDLFVGEVDCSQVVAGEFSEQLGIEKETLRKVAACFGGGMMVGNTCGCVSGALMVIGLKYGITDVGQHDQKMLMLQKMNEFKAEFAKKHSSTVCRELLGYDLGKPGELQKALDSGRMMSFCPCVVSDTLEILKEIVK